MLYKNLLEQIEHGELPNGHPLPSEAELLRRYNLSRRTNRDAVLGLATTGRAIRHQGSLTRAYMPDKEPHRLVADLREPSPIPLATAAEPEDAAGDPAIEFVPVPGSEVHSMWHEGEYTVPAWDSERLGIAPGTNLRTYTLTLSIAGEPILISTSLVPPDLLSGSVTWHEKPVGELALAGVSAVFSKATLHSRVPTLDESEALNPVPGVPVLVVYRQSRVAPAGVPAASRSACVVVVARADRVHL